MKPKSIMLRRSIAILPTIPEKHISTKQTISVEPSPVAKTTKRRHDENIVHEGNIAANNRYDHRSKILCTNEWMETSPYLYIQEDNIDHGIPYEFQKLHLS